MFCWWADEPNPVLPLFSRSINTRITAVGGIPLLCFPHLFSQLKVMWTLHDCVDEEGCRKTVRLYLSKNEQGGGTQKHCLTSFTSPEQGDESPSDPPTYVNYTSTICTQQLLLPLPAFVHPLFPCLPIRSGHSLVASRLRDVILADEETGETGPGRGKWGRDVIGFLVPF